MKRFLLSSLVIVVVVGLVLSGCAKPAPAPEPTPAPAPEPTPAPAPEPIVLKAVSASTLKIEEMTPAFTNWVDMVNERAKGELVIDIIGGPEAIPPFDQLEAVRSGVVDICRLKGSYAEPVVPEALSLVYSELSPTEEREVGYYDLMAKLFEEKANVKHLGRMLGGMPFYLYTTKKIEDPRTDFKGLRMRSAAVYDPLYEKLGIVRVTMPVPDFYSACERGIVDGTGFPNLIPALGWQEILNYCVYHGFYPGTDVIIIVNMDTWNSLPKPLQALLTQTVIEMEPRAYVQGTLYNKRTMAWLFDHGLEPIVFSTEDAEWYLNLAYEAGWETLAKAAPENCERIKEMIAK